MIETFTLINRLIECGVGSNENKTLSETRVKIYIDKIICMRYFILLSMLICKTLIGTDILNNVIMRIRKGVVTITNVSEQFSVLLEINRIDIIEANEIDLIYIRN